MKPGPVHNRLLISVQRPHLWMLSAAVIIGCVILLVWFAYEYGRYVGGFDQSDSEQEIASLQQRIEELTANSEDLQRRNAKLIRDQGIDRDAGSQVQKELARAQSQILGMREELTFYRNIVKPNKAKRTVVIKKVQLVPEAENQFRYKLVLIQDGRHDAPVRGNVELSFEGSQSDGQIVRLDLPTVSVQKESKSQRFGFKYFQNFEGSIRFPADFTPMSMFIRVLPSSSNVPRINESFVWDDLIAGGEQPNVGQTEN
jgi:cell division protein FtsB